MVITGGMINKFKIKIPLRNKEKIDKKCPFYGKINLRGRILRGKVRKIKMKSTIIVRIDYLKFLKKYNRFVKRHKNIPAHLSNLLNCKVGDIVIIAECRPISKTVRFNVIKVFAKVLPDV